MLLNRGQSNFSELPVGIASSAEYKNWLVVFGVFWQEEGIPQKTKRFDALCRSRIAALELKISGGIRRETNRDYGYVIKVPVEALTHLLNHAVRSQPFKRKECSKS